jgi:hypothetical protein
MLLRIGRRTFRFSLVLLCGVAGLAHPLVASGDEIVGRPPKSGIYVIWYSGKASSADLYLRQPYVVGGQIVLQWRDVEPAEGKYNFTRIDEMLADLESRGLSTTIQINGNRKPDWVFEKVPYVDERLSHQVASRRGTLMYWHETHRDAYCGMLRALAVHLKGSPFRKTILGLRLNFNAFGTEHTFVPAEYRSPDSWIIPAGVDPATVKPWTSSTVEEYTGSVVDTYIQSFGDSVRIFVRNGVADSVEQRYRDQFENGTLSWFHTSSEVEPRAAGTERRYLRFYRDCRSGKTTAYAEPWASCWGHHGGKTDDRWCSSPQWMYWRLLSDLNCGVSHIALYASDLRVAIDGTYRQGGRVYADGNETYQREFDAAIRFAAKYVGYHASPKQSPGAWVAFRENDVVRAENGMPARQRKLSVLTGDYSFLMKRLPGDRSIGQDVVNVGPDDQRFGAWARRMPARDVMRLALDEAFVDSLQDTTPQVKVVYLDEPGKRFELSIAGRTETVSMAGTGHWQTASFDVVGSSLQPDSAGAHIQLRTGEDPIHLHMVEVERAEPQENP